MTKKTSLAIVCLVILAVFAVLFVVGTQKLYPEEIEYNGQTLTWSKIPFADYYEIYIDDREPIKQSSNAYTFPNGGTFQVKIVVHKKWSVFFHPCEAEQTFTFLPRVVDLRYEGGILSWSPIEDASSYEVKATTPHGVYTYYPTENQMAYTESGPVTFEILARGAVAGQDYSYWSNPYSIHILGAPASVSYDATAGKLTWGAVSGATGYRVQFSGQAPIVTAQPTCDFHAQNQSFTVSIQSIGSADQALFDSPYSPQKTYTYQPGVQATSIRFTDGILEWDEVPGISSYYLTVGGTRHTVNGTSYTGLAPAQVHTVSLIPVCPNNSYSHAAERTLSYLQAPALSVQQEADKRITFSWAAVAGATRYVGTLYKDGVPYLSDLPLQQTSYTHALTESGRYTFTVRSASDVQNCYASASSTPIAVVRMAPCSGSSFSSDRTSLQFQPIEGAQTYTIEVTGQAPLEKWYYTYLPLSSYEAGTYTVKIYANSYTHTDGTLYLASETAHTATFTKLNAPANLVANKISDTILNLQWTPVANADGYRLQIERTDAHFGSLTLSFGANETSVAWTELLRRIGNENANWHDGIYSIKVCAVGESADRLSSSFAGDSVIHAFPAVTEVKMQGTRLVWSAPDVAYTYLISLGGKTFTTADRFLDLVALPDGYLLSTSAISASVTIISGPSTASVTASSPAVFCPYTISALPTVQSVVYQNGTLSFASVNHATGYLVSIQYLDGTEWKTAHTLPAQTTLTLPLSAFQSYLTQGKQNRLCVVALGTVQATYGSYHLNSAPAYTDPLTVLQTPVLSWEQTTNTLSWEQAQGDYDILISTEKGIIATLYNNNKTSYDLSGDLTAGEHTVYVQFISTSDGTISSAIASLPVTVA